MLCKHFHTEDKKIVTTYYRFCLNLTIFSSICLFSLKAPCWKGLKYLFSLLISESKFRRRCRVLSSVRLWNYLLAKKTPPECLAYQNDPTSGGKAYFLSFIVSSKLFPAHTHTAGKWEREEGTEMTTFSALYLFDSHSIQYI